MGLLRFLLALSVAWTHAGLPKGLSGDLCVTIFFVISGFYMAMVLSENPAYGQVSAFYQQRLLRLFPTYWALLALALLAGAISSIQQGWATVQALQLPQNHPGLFVGWLLSHLFIIGQDVFHFVGFGATGDLAFERHATPAEHPLAALLVIPPAWSLSLEITFYLLVPFLVRRSTGVLVGLMLASCAIRLASAYGLGLIEDPWATRFFLSELAFFLVGMLAYRLVAQPGAKVASLRGAGYLAICAAAVGSLAANNFGHVNAGLFSKAAVVTLVLTVAIPWLFMLTRNNRLDRHVGEYSYPLYLCHVLVFELWGLLQWSSPWSGYLMIATATALAVVLTVAVDKPVDRFRHRLLRAK
jgi:peptidoglycan/LPS O-acetylase OafA/YrhL